MKKTDKKTKWKYGVLAIVFSLAFVAPELFQFVDFGTVEKNQPKSWFNPNASDFFYDDTIDETSYPFNAHNESYIVCKIQNAAYSNFTLDGTIYNVSYGMNYIPIDFGNENKTYTVTFDSEDISSEVYDWFTVQPVIIDSGLITINPSTPTDITFEAAGLVSFFVLWNCTSFNNFTYDELYVEYDGTVINEIRGDWDHKYEVDPMLVSSIVFDGPYLQYDIHMDPGTHTINLKGNATVDYKIVVSGDWDNDGIDNAEEIQKETYSERYHIFAPIIWGYFEKGDDYKAIIDPEFELGVFNFIIPDAFNDQYLRINVISGSITNITIDDDDITFKDIIVENYMSDYPEMLYAGKVSPGMHTISYEYTEECILAIQFMVNGSVIPVFQMDVLSDKDSDGVLDIAEEIYGTNSLYHDTDRDSLPDGFDPSIKSKIVLNNSKITEIVMPHNSSRETLIDVSVKKFETDYTTYESKLWNDMEVVVVPMMRVFGNSTISKYELMENFEKNIVSYDFTGTNPDYCDAIPNEINPELEYTLIRPVIAEETMTYTLKYNLTNPAKDDSKIVLRFDFVWTVISIEAESTQIVHYYDIEEVILQALIYREISPIDYILASPESMTESQIIWNLIQNPNLGSFSDFGVSDDIVESGSANYSELMDTLLDIRETDPISVDESNHINETEVTYFAFLFSEYDVLQNMSNQQHWSSISEIQEKACWKELFTSIYMTSDIAEGDIIDIFNGGTAEAIRLCYSTSFDNYSTTGPSSLEERYNIGEFPIYMNNISFDDADVLEITFAQGQGIPLDKFPDTIESEIHDKMIFTNITTIENKNDIPWPKAPRTAFDIERDIKKVSDDTRILDVPFSDLMFNEYSESFLNLLLSSIENRIHFDYFHWTRLNNEMYRYFMPEAIEAWEPRILHGSIDYENLFVGLPESYRDAKRLYYFIDAMITDIGNKFDDTLPFFENFRRWDMLPAIMAPEFEIVAFQSAQPFWEAGAQPSFGRILDMIFREQFEIKDPSIMKFRNPQHVAHGRNLQGVITELEIMQRYDDFYDLLDDLREAGKWGNLPQKLSNIMALEDVLYSYTGKSARALEFGIAKAQEILANPPAGQAQEILDMVEEMMVERQAKLAEILPLEERLNWIKARVSYERKAIERLLDMDADSNKNAYIQKMMHRYYLKKFLVSGIVSGVFSALMIFAGFMDIEQGNIAKNEGDLLKAEIRFTTARIKFSMAALLILSFGLDLFEHVAKKHLSKLASKWILRSAKFLPEVVNILGFVLDIFMLAEYIPMILNNPDFTVFQKALYTIVLISLVALETVLMVVGLWVALSTTVTMSTAWIPYVGILISLITMAFLMFLFPDETSYASGGIETSNVKYSFPIDSIRRRGGLVVGEQIGFSVDMETTGTQTAYMQCRMDAGESGYSDWAGDWDNGHSTGNGETISVSSTLDTPMSYTNITTHVMMAVNLDGKETVFDEEETTMLPIPILDVSIEDFYDDLTTNPNNDDQNSYDTIILELYKYKDSFEHDKTAEILDKLSNDLTYDFLGDEPGDQTPGNDDWDTTELNENRYTVILRPNELLYNDIWYTEPEEVSLVEAVNEEVYFMEGQASIYSYAHGDGLSAGINYGLDQIPSEYPGSGHVTEIKVYTFATCTIGSVDVLWRKNSGQSWSEARHIYGTVTPQWGWRTNTFTTDFTDDLDDLQIRFYISPLGPDIKMAHCYVRVTYESDLTDPDPEIVSEYKGHTNVMNVTALGQYASTEFYHDLGTSKSSGIIDFWMNKNEYSNVIFDKFFQIDRGGSIFNYDGTSYIRPRPITIDEWIHFSVDFDSDDSFDLYINGIQCGTDITRDTGDVSTVSFTVFNNFETFDAGMGNISCTYFDAIDYDWDEDWYQWRSFAYDYSQANITYYQDLRDAMIIETGISTDLRENIVEMSTSTHIADFDFYFDLVGTENPAIDIELINLPDGFSFSTTHIDQNLQTEVSFDVENIDGLQYAGTYFFEMNVTLNGDSEIIYHEIIPFKIPHVEDLSFEQQNVIYENNDINNGNYTTTIDFLDDTIGENPSGWSIGEGAGQGTINVIESKEDHYKVLEIYDDTNGNKVYAFKSFTAQTSGTIEFYWSSSDVSKKSRFTVIGSYPSSTGPEIYIESDKFHYYDGMYTIKEITGITPLDNTWYHIGIEFDVSTDKFSVYIDDTLAVDNANFYYPLNNLDEIRIYSDEADYSYYTYIDSITFSWDTDYRFGDNKFETDTLIEDITESQVAKGDLVDVEFRTNTYAEVQMSFVNNDVVQETYTILPRGNNYYGIQTKLIIVNTSITFDEIQFTYFEYNYFDVLQILITDSLGSVGTLFNPVDITNDGNAPEYVQFGISGVDAEDVYAASSPGIVEEVDREDSVDWDNEEYAKIEDGNYASSEITISGGGGPGDSTQSPGTAANVDRNGKRYWSAPNNAKTSNNQDTNTFFFSATYSDWLRVTNFGFNIPEGATIDGIKVRIEKAGSSSNKIKDSSLRLRKTSGQVGDDKADTSTYWATSDTYIEYGGSTDTWSAGLTYSDVNSADFGIDFSAQSVSSWKVGYVDHIEVTVYYTESGGSSETESDILRCTDFDFADSIPDDAIISGVVVEIDKHASEADTIKDYSIRLRKPNGDNSSVKKSSEYWDTTDAYEVYGSLYDTWNLDLTYNDVVNPNFGVDIVVENEGATSIAYIDHVRVKVYYSNYFAIEILPGETIETNFTIEIPTESISNIICRGITYSTLGSNKMYRYIDNFEIDEIHIVSPMNTLYNVIGNNLSCNKDELRLEIIPEVVLSSMNYSLDGAAQVSFSDNSVNVPLPETEGVHTIQVLGEGSGPTYYESEVRNFTIRYPIGIEKPNETENTLFHEFSEDFDTFSLNDVNAKPDDWTVVDSSVEEQALHISGLTIYVGTGPGGSISNAQNDDDSYFTLTAEEWSPNEWGVDADFTFNYNPKYRDFKISFHIECYDAPPTLQINGATFRSGHPLDEDDVFKPGVNTVNIIDADVTPFTIKVYFFKMVDQTDEGTIEVVESMNGMSKPVQISNENWNDEFSMERDFPEGYETGNVTFSILRENTTDKNTVLVTLSGTSGTMVLTLENNDLYEGTYGSKTMLAENVLKQDVWQEFVIFFNVSEGCQLFVDGVNTTMPGVYSPFSTGTPTDIDSFKIETVYHSGEDYSFWFDNFLVNEIKSGFILDFYNRFIYLDDFEYSFDEGTKTSFTDRELFSFPEDGLHNVTIYGTDFYGDEYRSEFKIFTTGETYDVYSITEDIHAMPEQWDDFTYTYGSNGGTEGTGSTEYNDGDNYVYMNTAEVAGSETYLGYIVPNGDIYTGWNEADSAPHWSKLDEATGDMNGDGGNIRESGFGVQDRWSFDDDLTIPGGAYVSKLVVNMYSKRNGYCSNYIRLTSNCFGGLQWITPNDDSYTWKTRTITGLNIDQTELNGFYLNVYTEENEPPNSWVDIETVYIQVYYKPISYRHTSIINITIPETDFHELDTFYYDYATIGAGPDCDLDIYNWETESWEELKSNSGQSYITDSFTLTSDYLSDEYNVQIRFETAVSETDFDLRLDQIMVSYSTYGKKYL